MTGELLEPITMPSVTLSTLTDKPTPGCTNTAYDDGTGSGALLELARTFAQWEGTPLYT